MLGPVSDVRSLSTVGLVWESTVQRPAAEASGRKTRGGEWRRPRDLGVTCPLLLTLPYSRTHPTGAGKEERAEEMRKAQVSPKRGTERLHRDKK